MAYSTKLTKAKKWTNARKRGNARSEASRKAAMAKIIADQANMSEMAWSPEGASWECEADNENGQCIFKVVENVITSVEQYSYRRRVTFTRDGQLYQFTCTMGHDGDHEYDAPYKVNAVPVSTFKYEKVEADGPQDNRPAGPAALPGAADLPPWGGWGRHI